MQRILSPMKKAIKEFQLIEEGDRIGIGVSGGKDSMVLLKALKLYQQFSPINFELEAFTIDLGFEGFDTESIKNYCESLDVPFNLKETHIKKVVFDIRKEKNPCSLCANMRRGALNSHLKDKGFNKLALGHHSDDAIETLFLSMLYEGRLRTLPPKSFLTRKEIYVIRPFIYLYEEEITKAVNRENIPISKNPCYVDKETKREEIRILLNSIYSEIPGSRKRIFRALQNKDELRLLLN